MILEMSKIEEEKETICPWCGCKGKKIPHKRKIDLEKAKEYQWEDMICSSCKRAFKSY